MKVAVAAHTPGMARSVDVFARLLTFPNVVITAHQAFFTEEALCNVAETTLANVSDFEHWRPCPNEVTASPVREARA